MLNKDNVEIIRQNKLGSTEQLKTIKERSELIKEILFSVLPVLFVILIVVILLIRWLFK